MEQKINPLQANQERQSSHANRNTPRQRAGGSGNTSFQAGRTVGSTSANYGVTRTASSLHVGDILRGEITDLRNNEISITLEDNTVVRGQIPDSVSYSIGQTGSFRLADIAGSTIYLENVSMGYSETELTLINKALEEANLPATEHNQATVKALMDNLLPINRESIQNLMQQAYDLQTEDMNTLAVMKRLMMNIDTDSVKQFSDYRNDNYQLLERLQDFSQSLPSLLSALADNGPADAVASFGKSLLSIGLSSPGSAPPQMTINDLPTQVQEDIVKMLSDTPLTEDALMQLHDRTLSLQDALTMLRDAALSGSLPSSGKENLTSLTEQLNRINQVLEPASENPPVITEDFVKTVITLKSEENPVSESSEKTSEQAEGTSKTPPSPEAEENVPNAATKTESRFAFAGKFLQSLSENAKNTLNGTLDALRQATAPQETAAETPNHSLTILADTYEKFARNQDLLSTYLSTKERNELLNHLQNLPISRTMLMKIASGEASTKDVLTVINNTIGISDSEQIQSLFQSPVFEKLFARELQSAWTMTPEQLAKGDISEFYSKMHTQMRQYHNLIQSTLSGSDSQQLGNSAHDIESNISFMKTLNETFSYFQLPLKLPSQDAHSDLYVYTQKERLRQNPDKASVLLHLDMEHLGTIDIRLDRNRNDIIAQFSLNDQESVNLFRVNEHMLKDALNLQGYQCQIKIQEKEQPSPSVDDFINTKVNTHATTEMKRFSFDIRA